MNMYVDVEVVGHLQHADIVPSLWFITIIIIYLHIVTNTNWTLFF